MLFRGSVMLTPLFFNRFNISVTLAVGCCCLRMAQAPDTCAAASEVPDASAYPLPVPGIGALIRLPGASRFRRSALFDCGHIVSTVPALPFSVAPTLITEDIQAGCPNLS